MNHSKTIFTIGHSNHSFEYFLDLLEKHEVDAIADVRSSPYSQFNPQFNREELMRQLAAHSVAYVFLGEELGARRTEPECYVAGKVCYEKAAETAAFYSGIERILDGTRKFNIAVMCAEKDPLTCHRTILIARQLRKSIERIVHILPDGRIETHEEAESRLLKECKLQNQDFLVTDEERLDLAYQRRGEQIAFEETSNEKDANG